MTPRKFYGCSELQKLLPKNSNPRKNIIDSVNFFCVFFILYKRKNLTNRATIKSWNRRCAQGTLKAYLAVIILSKYLVNFLSVYPSILNLGLSLNDLR